VLSPVSSQLGLGTADMVKQSKLLQNKNTYFQHAEAIMIRALYFVSDSTPYPGHQNSLFAVKIVSKQKIVEFENFEYITRETEVLSVLASCCHPFLIGS